MTAESVDAMTPEPFKVRRSSAETHDTFTLELEPPQGNGGFIFSPGQFNMVYAHGVGEVPLSISGNPSETDFVLHTTRDVGAVTKALRKLRKGDEVGVRGPFGTSWPLDEMAGHDVVIVVGGIGLPPLRPVIYRVLEQRERYGRVVLLYGTRSPLDILYRKELEAWRARLDVDVHVTVERGAQDWKGDVGVVTMLIPKSPFDPRRTVALICGPEVMIRFTAMELVKRGVAPDQVFVSMERNMKCGIGLCGHCQLGPVLVCRDGPVFRYPRVQPLLLKREI